MIRPILDSRSSAGRILVIATWAGLLALTGHPVRAGDSANYSVTPLAQAAGGRSASANYTIDSAAQAGGAAASSALALRSGFAGAIFDVSSLQIGPDVPSVDEGASLQLSASLVLDDQSQLAVAASEVSWQAQAGPVTVNSSGLVTGQNVYQNSAATVQGNRVGLQATKPLTVLDVSPDNFGSYAGDGLSDAWQVLYFGLNNPSAAPLLDPDYDGWTNLFEYAAGLVPTDRLSTFSVRLDPVPSQPSQRRIIFSPRLAGHVYSVMFSESLGTGGWSPLTGATVSDAGSERTVTDPNATGNRRFYRVDVRRE